MVYSVLLDREVLVGLAGGYFAAEAVDVVSEEGAVLSDDHHRDTVEADWEVGEPLVVRMLEEPGRRCDLAPFAGCHASVVGHALVGAAPCEDVHEHDRVVLSRYHVDGAALGLPAGFYDLVAAVGEELLLPRWPCS